MIFFLNLNLSNLLCQLRYNGITINNLNMYSHVHVVEKCIFGTTNTKLNTTYKQDN